MPEVAFHGKAELEKSKELGKRQSYWRKSTRVIRTEVIRVALVLDRYNGAGTVCNGIKAMLCQSIV